MVTTNSTRLFLALIAALLLFFLCVVSWNGQDLKQQSAVEAADVQENLRVSAAATDVEESQKHRRTLDFISLLPLLGHLHAPHARGSPPQPRDGRSYDARFPDDCSCSGVCNCGDEGCRCGDDGGSDGCHCGGSRSRGGGSDRGSRSGGGGGTDSGSRSGGGGGCNDGGDLSGLGGGYRGGGSGGGSSDTYPYSSSERDGGDGVNGGDGSGAYASSGGDGSGADSSSGGDGGSSAGDGGSSGGRSSDAYSYSSSGDGSEGGSSEAYSFSSSGGGESGGGGDGGSGGDSIEAYSSSEGSGGDSIEAYSSSEGSGGDSIEAYSSTEGSGEDGGSDAYSSSSSGYDGSTSKTFSSTSSQVSAMMAGVAALALATAMVAAAFGQQQRKPVAHPLRGAIKARMNLFSSLVHTHAGKGVERPSRTVELSPTDHGGEQVV